MSAPRNGMRPVHPGEVLREDYLVPLGLDGAELAKRLGVPSEQVTELLAERRSVTADTALRLSRALGTTPQFWLNLQQSHDRAS